MIRGIDFTFVQFDIETKSFYHPLGLACCPSAFIVHRWRRTTSKVESKYSISVTNCITSVMGLAGQVTSVSFVSRAAWQVRSALRHNEHVCKTPSHVHQLQPASNSIQMSPSHFYETWPNVPIKGQNKRVKCIWVTFP